MHAPLPYSVEGEGQDTVGILSIDNHYVAFLKGRAKESQDDTAAFIVRACNSHYELVEALELARKALSGDSWYGESYYVKSGEYAKDTSIIHAALAKAKAKGVLCNSNSLALAACMAVVPAHAVDVEVGTGYSFGITQPDGAGYYQEAFPHWIDTDDQVLSFGLSWKPDRLRYRVEFLPLGKQSVNSVITADHQYNPRNVVNCVRPCRTFSLTGNGSVSGAVFSVSRDMGNSPAYVEAGVYAHVTKWQAKISDFDGNVLDEAERQPSVSFGPVVGIGWRADGIDVGVRYIYLDDSAEGDPMTPMLAGAYVVSFKVYF